MAYVFTQMRKILYSSFAAQMITGWEFVFTQMRKNYEICSAEMSEKK